MSQSRTLSFIGNFVETICYEFNHSFPRHFEGKLCTLTRPLIPQVQSILYKFLSYHRKVYFQFLHFQGKTVEGTSILLYDVNCSVNNHFDVHFGVHFCQKKLQHLEETINDKVNICRLGRPLINVFMACKQVSFPTSKNIKGRTEKYGPNFNLFEKLDLHYKPTEMIFSV